MKRLITYFLIVSVPSLVCSSCYTSDKVDRALADTASSGTLSLLRVRFPGTASSHFRRQYKEMKKDKPYQWIFDRECKSLCFEVTNNNRTDASWSSPFVKFVKTPDMGSSHLCLESVVSHYQQEGMPWDVVTSLRDPAQYAYKWYSNREIWDDATDFVLNTSFPQWITVVPWRQNVLVRNLGGEHMDAASCNMLHTRATKASEGSNPWEDDSYMIRENALGKESQVYQRALQRLTSMVHFGIFDRQEESWELVQWHLCWDPDKVKTIIESVYSNEGSKDTKLDFVKTLATNGEINDEQVEDVWRTIQETNRLDYLLLDAAHSLMDERLAEMKEAKRNGIFCNFGRQWTVTCDEPRLNDQKDEEVEEL